MTGAQRSSLAGKVQKGKKVTMKAINDVFEAACGPDDQAASKGTKVGWMLAQLSEELVAAADRLANSEA